MTNVIYDDSSLELPRGYHRDRYGVIKDDMYHNTVTMEEITRVEAERALEVRRRQRKKMLSLFFVRLMWGSFSVAILASLVGIGSAFAALLGGWAFAILPGLVAALGLLYGAGMATQRIFAMFKAKW